MDAQKAFDRQLPSARALYIVALSMSLLMILGTWTFAYMIDSTQQSRDIGHIRLANELTFNSFTERTIGTIDDIDRSTIAIKSLLEADFPKALSPGIFSNTDLTTIPGVELAAFVDAKGVMVMCTVRCDARSVADREYFNEHRRSRKNDLHISSPELSRSLGRWVIHLSRRVNDAQGNFVGLILVALEINHLAGEPKNSLAKQWGTYTLASSEGTVLLQRTPAELRFSHKTTMPITVPVNEYRSDEAAAKSDPGLEQVALVSQPGKYPIVVIGSVDVPQALASMKSERLNVYSVAFSITALLVVAAGTMLHFYRRVDARLRRSLRNERTYNSIIHGTTHAFCTLTYIKRGAPSASSFVVAEANRPFQMMFAGRIADVTGANLRELLPELITDTFVSRCVSSMKTGDSFHNNIDVRFDVHSTLSLYYQVIPIDNGIALIIRDLTDSNRIVVEHRQNRRFLQAMIDKIPALIHVISLREPDHGNIVVWNKACEDVTGYKASGVLNRSAKHVFDSKTAEMVEYTTREIQLSPEPIERKEHMVITRDGATRYMDSTFVPIKDESDNLNFVLGISIDVTKARRHRLEVQTQTKILQACGDILSTPTYYLDIDGTTQFVNTAFTALTGITRELAATGVLTDYILEEDHEHLEVVTLRARLTNQEHKVRIRFRHTGGGEIIDTVVSLHPVQISSNVCGFMGIVTPSTQRNRNRPRRQPTHVVD